MDVRSNLITFNQILLGSKTDSDLLHNTPPVPALSFSNVLRVCSFSLSVSLVGRKTCCLSPPLLFSVSLFLSPSLCLCLSCKASFCFPCQVIMTIYSVPIASLWLERKLHFPITCSRMVVSSRRILQTLNQSNQEGDRALHSRSPFCQNFVSTKQQTGTNFLVHILCSIAGGLSQPFLFGPTPIELPRLHCCRSVHTRSV